MEAREPNQYPTAELVPGTGYLVRQVPLRHYLDCIEQRRFFAYTKLNHGFWERVLNLRERAFEDTPEGRRAADERKNRRQDFFLEGGFYEDMCQLLRDLPVGDRDLHFAVSHQSFPGSDQAYGDRVDPRALVAVMREMLPPGLLPEDGLLWKQAALSGEIESFFALLRDLPVVAVGPAHLAALGPLFQLSRFQLEAIHPTQARAHREQTLANLLRRHQEYRGEPVAYLIQAGSLAAWFVLKLHRQLKNAFLIEAGRTLDICDPSVLFQQQWALNHREAIWHNLGQADTTWKARRCAIEGTGTPARRPGPPATIPALAGKPAEPLLFVENKPVDLDFVAATFHESAASNRWSNFGPLSRRVETAIARYVDLPADRRVILCCNATIGLFSLVALHEFLAKRPLRWLVSAFGFHCSHQGPLAQAEVLDCDAHAMLDLKLLEKQPLSSYDGVVITNVFGLAGDIAPYVNFCRRHQKALICDAATALDCGHRSAAVDEVISFHHTKPWGMGEGGCVIVDQEHEDAFRSLINFGIARGVSTGALSTNGKISDFAAAFILQRLRDFTSLADCYRMQFGRIKRAALPLGYELLTAGPYTGSRPGSPVCVPLLAPGPVTLDSLENDWVVLRKYYVPLAKDCPMAWSLYNRIVNFPCHPGLEALPTQAISEVLADILAANQIAGSTGEGASPSVLDRVRRWFKRAA